MVGSHQIFYGKKKTLSFKKYFTGTLDLVNKMFI